MDRVYTDERFPGCKIINDGSVIFRVYYGDKLLQSFETWESGDDNRDNAAVSEQFAARRASDYYDRWAKMEHTHPSDIVHHEVPMHPEGAEVEPPENVTGTIDDLMARYRLERSPGRQRALRRQILHLMKHENSVAADVVNELIAG